MRILKLQVALGLILAVCLTSTNNTAIADETSTQAPIPLVALVTIEKTTIEAKNLPVVINKVVVTTGALKNANAQSWKKTNASGIQAIMTLLRNDVVAAVVTPGEMINGVHTGPKTSATLHLQVKPGSPMAKAASISNLTECSTNDGGQAEFFTGADPKVIRPLLEILTRSSHQAIVPNSFDEKKVSARIRLTRNGNTTANATSTTFFVTYDVTLFPAATKVSAAISPQQELVASN